MDKVKRVGGFVTSKVVGESVKAYVPYNLPPHPPLEFNERLVDLLEEASQAIGRLDGATLMLPNPDLFIYMFLSKEALLSSQIEGAQSSFTDLVKHEHKQATGVPQEDVEEVSNYIAAINYGLKRLDENFPLSLRLLKEIHAILLKGARGQEKSPGEFRRTQNWIGGTTPGNALFVPPPANKVTEAMGAIEKFLHDDPARTSPLVKAALAHVQFETVHPFLDGNGRLGRLLISLILCAEGVLKKPLLYISLYLKSHRSKYYELLQNVREHGDWEVWLEFFLAGVEQTAKQGVTTILKLQQLFTKDANKITKLGRARIPVGDLFRYIQQAPITTIQQAASDLSVTIPTITKSVKRLCDLGILLEITGKERNKVYAYQAYIDILSEGAEPLSS